MTRTPDDTDETFPLCPICSRAMESVEVRNSLSRYTSRYICNHCGAMEAMLGLASKMHPEGRECLWYEPVTGVLALVNEKICGFKILADVHKADVDFIRHYIDNVNSKMGHTDQEVSDIITASMFTAQLTWTDKKDRDA